jgi:hypothetical protein
MQTIKGLSILLGVSLVILAVVGTNDIKSQEKYAVKSTAITLANTVKPGKPATMEAAIHATGSVKSEVVKTNTVARQKNKNVNL